MTCPPQQRGSQADRGNLTVKTNLKMILLVVGMSLAMLLGIFAFHAYRFEHSYKRDFLGEKKGFGEQVANIALTGLQTSNYFELSRLGTGLFRADSMLYLAILDDSGQQVHFSTERDLGEIEEFRKKLSADAVQGNLQSGGKRVAAIRSSIRDDTGKSWGTVEIVYYWDAAYRIFLDQLLSVFIFFVIFIPLWSAILLYNTRALLRPLDEFVANLGKIEAEWPIPMADFNSRLVPARANSEVKVLLNVLRTSLSKLIASQEAHEKEAKFSALGKQAAQVAHDIRSPLAAMDSITKDIAHLPEEKRIITRSAVGRIRDIANDLIERNRQLPRDAGAPVPQAPGGEPLSIQLLSSLIESAITEKRLQFRSKIGVEIDARFERDSYGLFARIQPGEFRRMLSNILNNAVEALEKTGSVIISATQAGEQILVSIKDTGKGIQPEILSRLGARGETHGKTGGSGLGLYHAKSSAGAWGGAVEIRSAPGKGTTVDIRIPRADTPGWFLSKLAVDPGALVVVLDDDTSIHQIWQGRFDSLRAGEQNIDLLHFSTPSEFRFWALNDRNIKRNTFYLLDYELLGCSETGLSLAEELQLGPCAALVTSRYEEKHVLDHCIRLKMRMLPKGLAGLIPISVEAAAAPESGPAPEPKSAILLDDDLLVHMNWKLAAKTAGVELRVFQTPEQLAAAAEGLPGDIPVYIDSDLGDNISGEDIAEGLRGKGFTNLTMTTGYGPEKFAHFPWLKVIGKEPPFGGAG